jgi:hypothetical protein
LTLYNLGSKVYGFKNGKMKMSLAEYARKKESR